jgi:hypothetical protein
MQRVFWMLLAAGLVAATSSGAESAAAPGADAAAPKQDQARMTEAPASRRGWRDLLADGKRAYEHGEFVHALENLAPALAAVEREPGAGSKDLIEVLDRLGMTQRELGRYTDAEATFRRELALNETAYGKKSIAYAENLLDLGQTLSDADEYERAAPLTEQANAILGTLPKVPDSTRSWALHELASVRYNQDRDREAEALWQQTLAIRLRIYGEKSTRTATTLFNLATLASNDPARKAEALRLFERALTGYEADAPEQADVGLTLLRIADIKRENNAGYTVLAPLYRRAIAIYERAYGAEHRNLAAPLDDLAGALETGKQYQEAIALRLRLLALIERHGESYGDAVLQHDSLAEDYAAIGDDARAKRHEDLGAELCRKTPSCGD